MPAFSVGDLVRVARQPNEMNVHIEGQVGYIDELDPNGTHARINALKVDGTLSGSGTVPLDCLELEGAAHWKVAKGIHDADLERRSLEHAARAKRYAAGIAEIAYDYGISTHEVEGISQAVIKLNREIYES